MARTGGLYPSAPRLKTPDVRATGRRLGILLDPPGAFVSHPRPFLFHRKFQAATRPVMRRADSGPCSFPPPDARVVAGWPRWSAAFSTSPAMPPVPMARLSGPRRLNGGVQRLTEKSLRSRQSCTKCWRSRPCDCFSIKRINFRTPPFNRPRQLFDHSECLGVPLVFMFSSESSALNACPLRFSHCSSLRMATPAARALAILLPASAPAIR